MIDWLTGWLSADWLSYADAEDEYDDADDGDDDGADDWCIA